MSNPQRPIVYYIAASLDGYIAREDGNLDWLFEHGRDYTGYDEFYQTIDTIIMGRATYDWILANGNWSYTKKCYVFTHRTDEPKFGVEFVNEDVSHFAQSLRQRPGAKIWLVGGAEIADAFLKAGQIDEFIITIIPVILGGGIPLFKKQSAMTQLALKEVLRFNNIVELHYTRKPEQ